MILPAMLISIIIFRPSLSTSHNPMKVEMKLMPFGRVTNQIECVLENPAIFIIVAL